MKHAGSQQEQRKMPARKRADGECQIFALRCANDQSRKAGEDILFTDKRGVPIPITVRPDLPID
jgi:hypothetical protein